MDNRPPIDRDLLLPILVGGFSVFGIIIILLVGRLNASRGTIPAEQTETPFKYVFLGTEPGLDTASPEVTEADLLTETGTPFDIVIDTPTPRPLVTVSVTPTRATPNATNATGGPPGSDGTSGPPIGLPTSTSASGPPLGAATYDDIDSQLIYDGPGWASQTGVAGAYHNTLHVSTVPDSSVSFRFIGKELRIFYLAGSSLGKVTISIDGQPYTLDEADVQSGNEWISPPLSNATHTATITHASGGSVNLDYVIIIPNVGSTGTPTATPTQTQAGGPPQ